MSGPEAPPCDNLYVSNLPDVVDDQILRDIFGQNVVSTKIMPPKQGSPTRVALVKFSSTAEATKKRNELNGGVIEGYPTPLNIRYVGKPWEQQQGGWQQQQQGGGWQGGYGKAPAASGGNSGSSPYASAGTKDLTNLYVKGLPMDIDEAWLKEQFSAYGQTVTQCKVQPSTVQGQPWHALIRFATKEDAAAALEQFQGADVENNKLEIDYVYKKSPAGAGGKADSGWGGKADSGWGGKADSGWGGNSGWGGKGDSGSGGKANGGFGGNDKGKGKGKGKANMDQILKAVQQAKFLPGAELSNQDNCMYVSGLPPDCEDIHLWRLCAPFGAIVQTGVSAMKDPAGKCKGIGFVNYVEDQSLQQAVATLNGLDLGDGNTLTAKPKK